jgi:hypothetical protein
MPKACVILLLLLGLWAQTLKASCCSSASSSGIGRLAAFERAYLEFYNDARYAFGFYNKERIFTPKLPTHLPYLQLSHELHAMIRLADFLQPFIKIPMRMSVASKEASAFLGSVALGARWLVLNKNFIPHAPALSIITLLNLPDKYEPIFITSGFALDKSFSALSFSFSYGLSLDPRYFLGRGFSKGIKQQASLQTSFLAHDTGRVALAAMFSSQGPSLINSKKLAQSSHYLLGFGVNYSWSFHSKLTLNAGVGTHIPLSYFGCNSNSEIFVRLGLRAGIF